MTIVLYQTSLHTEIRAWHSTCFLLHCLLIHRKCRWTSTWIWFSLWNSPGVSSDLNSKRLTSSLSCNVVNPGEIFPLEFHWLAVDSFQSSERILRCFEPSQSLFPCLVSVGGFSRILPRHNTESEKDVDLPWRWRLITLSSPINDRHFHEWFSQPIVSNPEFSPCSDTNLVDMSNICLSVRSVCIHNGLDNCSGNSFPMNTADSIVTVVNMPQIIECFSPSSVTFEIRFLSFSHLIIHPVHRMILIPLTILILLHRFQWQIVGGLAPLWSLTTGLQDLFTRYYLTHNGLRSSIMLSFLVREHQVGILVSLPKKLHRVSPIARTSQYQLSTLEKTKARSSSPLWVACWREAFNKWFHDNRSQMRSFGRCRYRVSPVSPLSQQLYSRDFDFHNFSSPGLRKPRMMRSTAPLQ